MRELLLPFCNQRRKNYINMVVIHASAQNTINDLVGVLIEREFSAHYVIGTNGDIVRLIPDELRAWHAGAGQWFGETEINSNSIGIELCNGLFGEEAYTPQQIEALAELTLHLIDKYDIKPHNIIGHSDMAPTRKIDPGTCFPWQTLAQNGIGLWPDKSAFLHQAITLPPEQLLASIGYPTDNLNAAEYAFMRHYAPKLYYELGGKKGANAGTISDFMPHDNKDFINTLNAVALTFSAFFHKENTPALAVPGCPPLAAHLPAMARKA